MIQRRATAPHGAVQRCSAVRRRTAAPWAQTGAALLRRTARSVNAT